MGELNYPSFSSRCDQQQQNPEPSYSPRSTHSHQASSAFLPSRTQCDIQNMMLPTTMAPEQPYMLQPGRSHQHGYDYTPHSAVSSFNAPAHCDSSLLTPVSMGGSPHLSTRSGSVIAGDRYMKSSPTSHHWMPEDDDFRYNQPMKYKDPTNALQIHTDSGFPAHYNSPEPYFGHLGVSAPSNAGRAMALSPSVYHNTNMNSVGGYSNGSSHSQNSTPPLSASSTDSWRSYDMVRSTDMIPVLHAAPNPLTLRPASRKVNIEGRQNSVHSNGSSSSSVSTQRPRKKKSPAKSSSDSTSTRIKKDKKTLEKNLEPFYNLVYPPDLTDEEKFLLGKAQEGTEWKKIVLQVEARTGVAITVPCAQMRKKRLVDRIREHDSSSKKRSEHGPNLASEHGSDYGSGPEGEMWGSDWDSMSKSPSGVKIKMEMESTSPEARSPNWHEPRSSYNAYIRNSSYPSLAPMLPSIQATTSIDRTISSGNDGLQYYQRSPERSRQEELNQHHISQHQNIKEEHNVREQQRRWQI